MKRRIVAVISIMAAVGATMVPVAQAFVTNHQAAKATLQISRRSCNHDTHCLQYSESQCFRPAGRQGIACRENNFERRVGSGKYTCFRWLYWTTPYKFQYVRVHGSGPGWNCSTSGWHE